MIAAVKLSVSGLRWSSSRPLCPLNPELWEEHRAKCAVVRNHHTQKVDLMIGQHLRLIRQLFNADSPSSIIEASDGVPPASLSVRETYKSATIHHRPNDMPIHDISGELCRMYFAIHSLEIDSMNIIFDFRDIDRSTAAAMMRALANQATLWSILDFWCTIMAKPASVSIIKPESSSYFLNPFTAVITRSLSAKIHSRTKIYVDANNCPHLEGSLPRQENQNGATTRV